MKFKLTKPIGKETHFTWGPVKEIHSIPALGIDIVEYHPGIYENASHTGEYELNKTEFHYYINGKDGGVTWNTLPQAIVGAITTRRRGSAAALNDNSSWFACKILDLLGEEDIVHMEFMK